MGSHAVAGDQHAWPKSTSCSSALRSVSSWLGRIVRSLNICISASQSGSSPLARMRHERRGCHVCPHGCGEDANPLEKCRRLDECGSTSTACVCKQRPSMAGNRPDFEAVQLDAKNMSAPTQQGTHLQLAGTKAGDPHQCWSSRKVANCRMKRQIGYLGQRVHLLLGGLHSSILLPKLWLDKPFTDGHVHLNSIPVWLPSIVTHLARRAPIYCKHCTQSLKTQCNAAGFCSRLHDLSKVCNDNLAACRPDTQFTSPV